jgi:uncharacterized protein with ParB-like and HNH nuclease domain
MSQLKPTKTVYTISEFLERQRNRTLVLRPEFQRGHVWTKKAKSLLIDTICKGLPIPIILLRQLQSLKTLKSQLEVIDGQQRLRTILSFVDPGCLPDFDAARDAFTVLRDHNEEVAEMPFQVLNDDYKRAIVGYELSVHIFPPETSDPDVLLMFSRLNSTGLALNRQELRNARFYGAFKTLMYRIAFQHLKYWRDWKVFSDKDLARMIEVESVSEYVSAMLEGIQKKDQHKLDAIYQKYDEELPGAKNVEARFTRVLEEIDRVFGSDLPNTSLHSQAMFYSLFTASYAHIYGLGSKLTVTKKANKLPLAAAQGFLELNDRIANHTLPENVQSAFGRSTTDPGRRTTRHNYFMKVLGLVPAGSDS